MGTRLYAVYLQVWFMRLSSMVPSAYAYHLVSPSFRGLGCIIEAGCFSEECECELWAEASSEYIHRLSSNSLEAISCLGLHEL